MSFSLVPCPEIYLRHKNNPELFVQYCESFIKKNDPGKKAVGVKVIDGKNYILKMPDYEHQRAVVTGSGKNRKVKHVPAYNIPIERFLSKEDFEYLEQNGRDRYGNKLKGDRR